MTTHISIKKIEVSISGLSAKTVNRSLVGFDKELSAQASKFLKGTYDLEDNLASIQAGNLHVDSDIPSGQLRRLVAERILKSIVRESL